MMVFNQAVRVLPDVHQVFHWSDSPQEDQRQRTEPEPEPEPVKRKTSSKRRVKKKVTLFTGDNIIFDDPDVALELGKSISKTKAEEAEAV
ncbi:hypothetical protein Tco_0700457 [Tanacetum coccineum]